MDIFCEHIVKRKKKRIDYVLQVILIIVAVYLSLIAFSLSHIFYYFTTLVVAGIWYGVICLLRRKKIEYEYIITNTNLDIDRIFAKKTRRRITSIDITKIDYIRPVEESDYEKNPQLIDHFICEDKMLPNTYVLVFGRSGSIHRVFITPNDKMKRIFKEINPAKVTVKFDEEEE